MSYRIKVHFCLLSSKVDRDFGSVEPMQKLCLYNCGSLYTSATSFYSEVAGNTGTSLLTCMELCVYRTAAVLYVHFLISCSYIKAVYGTAQIEHHTCKCAAIMHD